MSWNWSTISFITAQVLLLQSRDLDLEASAAAHPVRVAQKLRAG